MLRRLNAHMAAGAQKETFGSGRAAQVEAGKKGGAISGEFSHNPFHAALIMSASFMVLKLTTCAH